MPNCLVESGARQRRGIKRHDPSDPLHRHKSQEFERQPSAARMRNERHGTVSGLFHDEEACRLGDGLCRDRLGRRMRTTARLLEVNPVRSKNLSAQRLGRIGRRQAWAAR